MIHSKNRVKRKGAMWPLMLGMLVLLMACLALVVDSALLWQARQELQVAADASALGAVLELTDDHLLIQREGRMAQVVERSMRIARDLAAKHHVLGQPLELSIDDVSQMDVVAGFFDPAVSAMQPASPGDWDSPFLNAIEVTGRRTRERGTPVGLFFTRMFQLDSADVGASSTALLDRHIIGFRPTGQLTVPLMPVGVLSDPRGMDEHSWEAQIDKPLSMGSNGLDQYAYNKSTRKWSQVTDGSSGDGLPEFTLRIPMGKESEETNGCLLQIGRKDSRTLLRQMETGLSSTDLQAMDGQLVLGWDGLLPFDIAEQPNNRALSQMIDQLEVLASSGEGRLWPLYQPGEAADQAQGQSSAGALVRGFIAARVAAVTQTDDYLEVILQPTVLTTGTAVVEPKMPANHYVGKIRLVR